MNKLIFLFLFVFYVFGTIFKSFPFLYQTSSVLWCIYNFFCLWIHSDMKILPQLADFWLTQSSPQKDLTITFFFLIYTASYCCFCPIYFNLLIFTEIFCFIFYYNGCNIFNLENKSEGLQEAEHEVSKEETVKEVDNEKSKEETVKENDAKKHKEETASEGENSFCLLS